GTFMADFVNARGPFLPAQRRRAAALRSLRRPFPVNRAQWIGGEDVLDVGHEQFLMLLLVVQAERRTARDLVPARGGGGGDQLPHARIDVLAVTIDLRNGRTREKAALLARKE